MHCQNSSAFVLLVLLAFVTLATASIGAQQQGGAALSADRSWAVQNQLKAIEQNRDRFVDDLLRQWANYLDPATYNLEETLRPIAMRVPAWQLYGASLAGDFPTFLRVLTGQEGAGRYINGLAAPQTRTAHVPGLATAEVGLANLGSNHDSLVFTPIAPCRVVDTRNPGARTGIMSTGYYRWFDFTTAGFAKGQGGVTSCVGLPSLNPKAWAVNVTVTGYSGSGWLVVWPYGGSEPTASVVNYGTSLYAVASGQTLTGCYGCSESVNVGPYYAGTHVIIDVVGYYSAAYPPYYSTISRMVSGVVNIPPYSAAFVVGGACPAGTTLIGGEVDHDYNAVMSESRQLSSTTWSFYMLNNGSYTIPVYGYSRCLDTPAALW